LKVAIIEDSSVMRTIITKVLKDIEHIEVIEAEDGLEGWKLIDNNPDVDLILTDWNMPHINGLTMTKKIKNDPRFKKTPIVMITTEGGKSEVINALKAGITNYIVKPFTVDILTKKLKEIMDM